DAPPVFPPRSSVRLRERDWSKVVRACQAPVSVAVWLGANVLLPPDTPVVFSTRPHKERFPRTTQAEAEQRAPSLHTARGRARLHHVTPVGGSPVVSLRVPGLPHSAPATRF